MKIFNRPTKTEFHYFSVQFYIKCVRNIWDIFGANLQSRTYSNKIQWNATHLNFLYHSWIFFLLQSALSCLWTLQVYIWCMIVARDFCWKRNTQYTLNNKREKETGKEKRNMKIKNTYETRELAPLNATAMLKFTALRLIYITFHAFSSANNPSAKKIFASTNEICHIATSVLHMFTFIRKSVSFCFCFR